MQLFFRWFPEADPSLQYKHSVYFLEHCKTISVYLKANGGGWYSLIEAEFLSESNGLMMPLINEVDFLLDNWYCYGFQDLTLDELVDEFKISLAIFDVEEICMKVDKAIVEN